MAVPRNRRGKPPLKNRTRKEQDEAYQILHGAPIRSERPTYDLDVHPAGLVAYFRKALDGLKDAYRVTTDKGQKSYLKTPVRPITLAGYAAEIHVSTRTLYDWSQKHEEFGEAVGEAKAIQEQVFVEMGLQGAYNPNVVNFVLKNLQGWTDKAEIAHKGTVVLKIDEQDSRLCATT